MSAAPPEPTGLGVLAERLFAAVVTRGDLAHLALLGWAIAASLFALLLFRESVQTSRRFDAFVRELARFNRRFSGDDR